MTAGSTHAHIVLSDLAVLLRTGSLPGHTAPFNAQQAKQNAVNMAANSPEPRKSRILARIRQFFPFIQ